jgi:hypothetical protein
MSLLHSIEILRRMDRLIRSKATGGQKEFSDKVGVHRSTLNEYLNEMKTLGFPIRFCNKKRTYYYEEEGKIVNNFFVPSNLSNDEMRKVVGGYAVGRYVNFFSSNSSV